MMTRLARAMRRIGFFWLALLAVATSFVPQREGKAESGLEKISHVIVLYLENRSFDNLLGEFPGANGLSKAQSTLQRERNGMPYVLLPPAAGRLDVEGNTPAVRAIKMGDLPN